MDIFDKKLNAGPTLLIISMSLYRETLIIFSAKESKNQIHGQIYQIIAHS